MSATIRVANHLLKKCSICSFFFFCFLVYTDEVDKLLKPQVIKSAHGSGLNACSKKTSLKNLALIFDAKLNEKKKELRNNGIEPKDRALLFQA